MAAEAKAGVEVVAVACGDNEDRRNVLKGQLTSCSPVFTRMLGGEFKEGASSSIEIGDFNSDAVNLFLDVVEFPRNGESYQNMAGKLQNKLSTICGIIDKYDCTSLTPLIVGLIEQSPDLENIVAFEKLVVDPIWSESVIDYIIKMTMGRTEERRMPRPGVRTVFFTFKVPNTNTRALSGLSSKTLAEVLKQVNQVTFEVNGHKQSFFMREGID